MAVELMMGYGVDSFGAKTEENAVKEAATAGIQSVEKFIRLISQQQEDGASEYGTVADAAVNKFKKVISLLDKGRTGHARFRRAPVTPSPSLSSSSPSQLPNQNQKETHNPQKTEQLPSAFKVYCPTPVLRLPPLPLPHNNNNNNTHSHHGLQQTQHLQLIASSVLTKNGPVDKKDPTTTIKFSPSPPISAAN